MMRLRREEGVSLVLALVFLSLFAIFVAALLSQVDTNIRVTEHLVRPANAQLYAADAGVDYAIQKLRTDPEFCLGPPVTLQINGRTVSVTCEGP